MTGYIGTRTLSPAERRVAGLVAQGLTNPQIAAQLYVSRRTVQTHVQHALTKLGYHSRVQLAVYVTRVAAHAESVLSA